MIAVSPPPGVSSRLSRAKYWQEYLDELASKNLTRDPPARRKS